VSLKTSEIILHTASALGEIRIEKFNDLFNAVWHMSNITKEEEFTFLRMQTLRFLDALGHAEYNYERRYLHVCDPLLVLLPTPGIPQAILTGARNSLMLKQLKKFVIANREDISLTLYDQPFMGSILPVAVYLSAVNTITLENAAKNLNIKYDLAFPASWSILNFSDSIEEIKDKLRFELHEEINWQQRVFNVESLTFTSRKSSASEIRLIEYTDPLTQAKLHWLWKDNLRSFVNRDWGRYILLSELDVNVIYYDSRRYLLVVPLTVPLPVLIARAITLCSGLVPRMINFNNRRYLVYSSIGPQLAEAVASKLGQSLMETLFDDWEF
jgi:hypothetical protein